MFLAISCRWVVNVVAVIASTSSAATIWTARMPCELVNDAASGILPNSSASPNCSACSSVMKPCAVPFLAAWSISRNSAKKIGIWSRIGRQDANGLVPESL